MKVQNQNNNVGYDTKKNTLAGKRFLTAVEVARLIGKHPKWLERKRWQGGGPAFRYIGKSPIYEEQDVLQWMEAIPKVANTSQLMG